MAREIILDVSELEPPQPFEEALKQLRKLPAGAYLRMLHRKQPLPLIQLLHENGYVVSMSNDPSGRWEIIIWNKSDPVSAAYCDTQFGSHIIQTDVSSSH